MRKTNLLLTLVMLVALGLVATACGGGSDPGLIDDPTDGDSPADGDDPSDGDTPTDGDDPADGDEPAEVTRFHIHLDHDVNFLPLDEEYVVHVRGQRIPLLRHNEDTQSAHPAIFAPGGAIPEEDIPTHYVDVPGLPKDRALMIYITQRSDKGGLLKDAHGASAGHGLAFPIIHVPHDARLKVIENNPRLRAKYARLLGRPLDESQEEHVIDILNTYTPKEVARTILFHHPDVLNLDPDKAALITTDLMDGLPGLNDLAYAIKDLGKHNWYDMQAVIADEGKQHTYSDGSPMFSYQIRDEVLDAAAFAAQNLLNAVKNEELLQGDSYHPTAGVSHIKVTDSEGARKARSGYTFSLSKTGFQKGLRTRIASSDGAKVELKFRNDWIRHLSIYAQFFDENNTLLSIPESDWDGNMGWLTDTTIRALLDTDYMKFLSLSSPVPTIFAIPIAGDYTETKVDFTWPGEARYARIRAGGLGHGGERNSEIEIVGAILTGGYDIGIPSMMLAIAIGMPDGGKALNDILGNVGIANALIQFAYSSIWSQGDLNFATVCKKLGVVLANFLASKAGQKVAETIIEYVIATEIEEAMPFAGWALAAAAIATTAAQLAQTSAEVASSPWIIENTLQPAHDIKLTIHHDVNDYQFPATAVKFRTTAIFSATDSRVVDRDLPGTTVSDPIVVWFRDVPAGGHVTFNVGFYSDTNWLAGQGTSTVLNMNSTGKDYLDTELTIKENLVPLDANSVYHHKQRLDVDPTTKAHIWVADTTPPYATRMNLSSAESGNALSELVNIAINQRTGDIGYVYRAYSPGVTSCNQGGPGQLYVFQNVSAKQRPDDNYKFSGCGYTDKMYMFYSLGIDDDLDYGRGASRSFDLPIEEQNFVLLPEDDDWLYVRHVNLDPDVDGFDIDHTRSFCKFPLRLDSAVVHPQGYIVGINHASPRIFSCKLTGSAVPDAEAPVAKVAGQQLTDLDQIDNNPALLANPIALALGPEGAILVLDDVSSISTTSTQAVVRAFNPDGTPLAYFGGELCVCDSGYVLNPEDPSSCHDPASDDHSGPGGICGGHGSYNPGSFVLPLKPETVETTYLSMGVEHKGFIYILGYSGTGANPSDYHMDIYEPNGDWLVRTPDVAAGKLTVDLWRNVYTLNYQTLVGPSHRTEPSVSEWIPPTPPGRGN